MNGNDGARHGLERAKDDPWREQRRKQDCLALLTRGVKNYDRHAAAAEAVDQPGDLRRPRRPISAKELNVPRVERSTNTLGTERDTLVHLAGETPVSGDVQHHQ
jgi:hypothetical protein